jgi:chromatin structure-remodeling complex protein RSC7
MTTWRRGNLDGVYDTHTNMMFYPTIMQPTHAKWEQIPPPSAPSSPETEKKQLTNGDLPNGTANHHDEPVDTDVSQQPTIFGPVPPVVSRNFTVVDTTFTSPPLSGTGYPGPDGSVLDPASGPNGLSSIPDDIVDELPEECRKAFEEARRTEDAWKRRWGTEKESGMRGVLKVGLTGWPV